MRMHRTWMVAALLVILVGGLFVKICLAAGGVMPVFLPFVARVGAPLPTSTYTRVPETLTVTPTFTVILEPTATTGPTGYPGPWPSLTLGAPLTPYPGPDARATPSATTSSTPLATP